MEELGSVNKIFTKGSIKTLYQICPSDLP